jgi:hypothetical protein
VEVKVANWGDDFFSLAGASGGVRVAAEHLAMARLQAFDTHCWKFYELPAQWWICQVCLLPIEATCGRPCAGVSL